MSLPFPSLPFPFLSCDMEVMLIADRSKIFACSSYALSNPRQSKCGLF